MAFGSNGSGRRAPLSEINVTPLVDIMLVLLIIFMVAAPMMTSGVQVDLPKTEAPSMEVDSDRLVLSIDKDAKFFLGKNEIPSTRLEEILSNNQKLIDEKEIYVQADENVKYGVVARAMGVLRKMGITKIGLVSEAEKQ